MNYKLFNKCIFYVKNMNEEIVRLQSSYHLVIEPRENGYAVKVVGFSNLFDKYGKCDYYGFDLKQNSYKDFYPKIISCEYKVLDSNNNYFSKIEKYENGIIKYYEDKPFIFETFSGSEYYHSFKKAEFDANYYIPWKKRLHKMTSDLQEKRKMEGTRYYIIIEDYSNGLAKFQSFKRSLSKETEIIYREWHYNTIDEVINFVINVFKSPSGIDRQITFYKTQIADGAEIYSESWENGTDFLQRVESIIEQDKLVKMRKKEEREAEERKRQVDIRENQKKQYVELQRKYWGQNIEEEPIPKDFKGIQLEKVYLGIVESISNNKIKILILCGDSYNIENIEVGCYYYEEANSNSICGYVDEHYLGLDSNLVDRVMFLGEVVKVKVLAMGANKEYILSFILSEKLNVEDYTRFIYDAKARENYLYDTNQVDYMTTISNLNVQKYKQYIKYVKKERNEVLKLKMNKYWGGNDPEVKKYPIDKSSLRVDKIYFAIISDITDYGAYSRIISYEEKKHFEDSELARGDIAGYCSPCTDRFINMKRKENCGIFGLIHISNMSKERVTDIRNMVVENEVVKVKVLNIDENRISLTLIL